MDDLVAGRAPGLADRAAKAAAAPAHVAVAGATHGYLEPLANLAAIREEVDKLLESHMNTENPNGNESHSGRQQSDFKYRLYF
jgi:hypothetical protein